MRAFPVRVVQTLTSLAAGLILATASLGAQAAQTAKSPQDEILQAERYVLPPEAILKLVDAPRETNFNYGAPNPGNRKYIMRAIGDGPPSLAAMSQTYYRLAGFEVDWSGNRARSMTTRSNTGLELYDWSTGKTTKIDPPAGARITSPSWSPDGNTLAYIANFVDATHIYLADPVTGKSKALTKTPLLATKVTGFYWTNSGKNIVAVFLPDNRPAPPKEPSTALTPRVRINEDNKLKTRTNPSLLDSPFEMQQYEYYITGQLGVIDVKTGKVTKVGTPGMINSVSPGSDAKYFRVTYADKPFSYYLPWSSFASHEVLMDETGKVFTQMSKRNMNEGVDPDSNPAQRVVPNAAPVTPAAAPAIPDTAKQSLAWNPIASGMMYLSPLPAAAAAPAPTADTAAAAAGGRGGRGGAAGGRGGAAGRGGAGNAAAAPVRPIQRIMQWVAPFDSTSSKVFYQSENQIIGFPRFSENGRIMFLSERAIPAPGATGNNNSPTMQTAIFLDENNARYVFSTAAVAAAAGGGRGGAAAPAAGGRGGAGGGGAAAALVSSGGSVMLSADGMSVFMQGSTADSGKPARPWVERVELKTGTKTRLYEAASSNMTETITAPLDADFTKAMIQRQSATIPSQSFILDLKTREAKQITSNRDLTPEITNTIKKTFTAHRADGYTFKVKVTLPPNWKEGQRLPALFWFYPSEFADQAAYDRGPGAPPGPPSNTFPTTGARTMSFITAAGYALVEPDAPIFGSNGMLPNDNYVNDLRNDLAAAIDVLDSAGVIIRSQLAIGGHSYGAFSAVNAMVNTPFFKAGIAGDGAYNRTLTPNGFQSEQRDLWQGRDTYLAMSPFLYADRLNGALLMYHSIDDQNVGTDPTNSLRMYHALQGLGKTVSLYMYPYEDHGPVARETNLDQWARWVAWLDKYVKGIPAKAIIP